MTLFMKNSSRFVMALLSLLIISQFLNPFTAYCQTFTKVTTGPVVNDGKGGRSANFIDYNNDGYLDIFISNGKSGGENNLLYLNDGAGGFIQITGESLVTDGGSSDGASWADADNDGDIDVAIANWYGQSNFFHINNGDSSFTKITTGSPVTNAGFSEACSWADYDSDGDLDLFIANSAGDFKDFLYENDGSANFTRITTGDLVTQTNRSRLGNWADYDNDGDLDLFLAIETNVRNRMYKNTGGALAEVSITGVTQDFASSFGSSWGDYDNDGDLDLFVANNFSAPNFLYQNNGDGTFTTVTGDPVVEDIGWSIGSSWIDYDNDGDLDLFVANGFHSSGDKMVDFLYTNNGDGSFTSVTDSVIVTDSGWSYGCAWGDFDKDGDLDVVIAKWLNETQNNTFFINNSGDTNNWVSITCAGIESNASAVGARVRVKATIRGVPTWQMREISSQSGYCSQNGLLAHFGLGDASIIDSIEVRWPLGIITVEENIAVDQFLTLYECTDTDGDRICDANDACPLDADNDIDGDGFCANLDNCPADFNPDQADTDNDGVGNVCDLCCNIPGNANDDIGVDVGDATFLVKYIFQAGSAPPCNDQADADGNNDVNISDATFLVKYIFQAGLSPVCGTTGT